MIGITPDPNDPNKLVLTQTITVYLDKLIRSLLDDEVASLIKEQAVHDIRMNKQVKKIIQEAATRLLLEKLGISPEEK